MEIHLLKDIIIILGLGVVILSLFNRIRIPPIVGFLFIGVLAGPHGFALVSAVKEVEIMAEIGVILLLFNLGLEFSFARMFKLKRMLFIGGGIQVGFTILLVYLIGTLLGLSWQTAVFWGFLISLSSTAIILKTLQEKSELDTPHGRSSVSILIFQDLIIVPMMLLTPLLSGSKLSGDFSFLNFVLVIILLLALLIISTKWLVPYILLQITRTRSRELFLMTIVFLAFAIAWITSKTGLSLALGAFLAGLIISESEYSHSAFAQILPFKDLFMAFFFVSIGMLMDVRIVYLYPLVTGLLLTGIVLLKFLTVSIAAFFLKHPLRTALLIALTLFQIGEFSFILSKTGIKYQLISGKTYQIFLVVSVISMMLTPFLISLGRYLEIVINYLPIPKYFKFGISNVTDAQKVKKFRDHLIIIGFGLNGQNLAKAATDQGINFIVVDMNPDTVRREKKAGIPIFYGDATHQQVLDHAGIKNARVLVLAINDPYATRRITGLAREMNPELFIIVRTRYVQDVKPLFNLGADEVIPEEFETTLELFVLVLQQYHITAKKISELSDKIRADGYQRFRS